MHHLEGHKTGGGFEIRFIHILRVQSLLLKFVTLLLAIEVAVPHLLFLQWRGDLLRSFSSVTQGQAGVSLVSEQLQ